MPLDDSPPLDRREVTDDTLDPTSRLEFLRIDPATSERLRRLQATVIAALPQIATEFYDFLGKWPKLAALLGDPDRLARLKETQFEHWQHLFSGSFDKAYFARAVAVGEAHERIGLEPRWYTASYCLIVERIVATLVAKAGAKKALAEDIGAMLRAAFLDMDLAISTYINAGEASRMRREMLAMSDVLEREMSLTAEEISSKAERLVHGAAQLSEIAEQVRSMAEAVSESIETTAQNVQTVASATTELEASSRDINSQVDRAMATTQVAVQQVSETGATVQALSTASERIAGVVALIRNVAGQTKLLALNATIEAARAGEAGKGFAVVASEVKSLARQTEDAIGNVNAQAQSIAGASTNAATMVEKIANQVRAVDAIAADIAHATEQQRSATGEIMHSVALAAEHTQSVADRARAMLQHAQTTDGSARQFRTLAGSVSTEIHDLHRRLAVILRASHAGDRRHEEREPVAVAVSFTTGGATFSGFTADLSPHGALLVIEAPEELHGHRIDVTLDRIGRLNCVVRAVSPLGVHVQFAALDPATEQAIQRALQDSRRFNAAFITACQSVAAEAAQALERGLAAGRITEKVLFSNEYVPIAGTDPQQHQAPSSAFCEAALADIIARGRNSDSRIIFCTVSDRNGYVPVHHPEVSQPQRQGDQLWNAANCRNRRIYDDRAAILAARNQNPSLVQTYLRDLGHGKTVLKEFDAPIIVQGKPWGAVRLAIQP